MQKRLVLRNLKESFQLFKTTYPDEKIGFSKFAELRPKYCVLAARSGTHSVCVCTTHQIVKLMIEEARLKDIRLNDGTALTKTTEEFVKSFCENLLVLKTHSFIAKKQSEHYNFVKTNVKENEAVVSLDFVENYGFVIQDEAQSFHWNNDQATIFPIAVHYRDCNDAKLRSIVCISEHLKHDTLAVHVFQKKLISYLRSELIPDIKKIYYFSDGSAAQFKN